MNPKRSFKFYRKNEIEVMEALGMKGTVNSGSGWIEKEDGQNDYVICQLKSTDAASITVKQKDIRILEKNADVVHKLPLFAIQFLNTGEVWLMAKPEDFPEISNYIITGQCESKTLIGVDLDESAEINQDCSERKVIKSSEDGRLDYQKQMEIKRKEDEYKWKNRLK